MPISLISDIENINTSDSRPPRIPAPPASWTQADRIFPARRRAPQLTRGRDAGRGPTHPEPAGAPAGTGTGQHLLYRNGRGVEPTEAGLRFVEHARALLALAERAREDLRSLRETPAGKVSVGLPPRIACADAAAGASVPARIPRRLDRRGRGLSAQVREWLLAGRVDRRCSMIRPPSLSWPASRRPFRRPALAAAPGARPARPHASRLGRPGRLSAGAAQPAQRHPHTGRQRLPRPGRAPAGGRGRRGADHRRAGRAGRCLRHPRHAQPPGDRRPSTRWRWPISSPPASSTTRCWRPPATVPRRGWPRPLPTDTRAGTARPVRPGKSAKMPARFLVWRLAAVKVPLASHLKQ